MHLGTFFTRLVLNIDEYTHGMPKSTQLVTKDAFAFDLTAGKPKYITVTRFAQSMPKFG